MAQSWVFAPSVVGNPRTDYEDENEDLPTLKSSYGEAGEDENGQNVC